MQGCMHPNPEHSQEPTPHWAHSAVRSLTIAGGALAGTLVGGPAGAVVGAAAGGAAASRIPPFKFDPRLSNPMHVIYLDVRTPQEQAQTGVISGAIRIPIDDLGPAWVPTLKAATQGGRFPILVYCRKGIRAKDAVEYLRAEGFDARNIGGIEVGAASRIPRRAANPSAGMWAVIGGASALAAATGGYAIYCRERIIQEAPATKRSKLQDDGKDATVQLVYGCPPHKVGYYFRRSVKFFVRVRQPGAADYVVRTFEPQSKAEAEALFDEWTGDAMSANPGHRRENACGPGIGRLPAVYGGARASNPPARARARRAPLPAKPSQQLAPAPVKSTALYLTIPPTIVPGQDKAALLVLRVGNTQKAVWVMYERVGPGKARILEPIGSGWNFAHQFQGMVVPMKAYAGNPAQAAFGRAHARALAHGGQRGLAVARAHHIGRR